MPAEFSPVASPALTVPHIPAPLQEPEIVEIHNALQRLRKSSENKIVTPESTAAIRADLQFVANALVGHAEEFLHCWGVVKTEYLPLVRALAIPTARAQSFLQPSAVE